MKSVLLLLPLWNTSDIWIDKTPEGIRPVDKTPEGIRPVNKTPEGIRPTYGSIRHLKEYI